MQRFNDTIGKIDYTIDPNHQRDWFNKTLLPLTWTPLTQQKIETLQDALDEATQIEAMTGYPHVYRGGGGGEGGAAL